MYLKFFKFKEVNCLSTCCWQSYSGTAFRLTQVIITPRFKAATIA